MHSVFISFHFKIVYFLSKSFVDHSNCNKSNSPCRKNPLFHVFYLKKYGKIFEFPASYRYGYITVKNWVNFLLFSNRQPWNVVYTYPVLTCRPSFGNYRRFSTLSEKFLKFAVSDNRRCSPILLVHRWCRCKKSGKTKHQYYQQ